MPLGKFTALCYNGPVLGAVWSTFTAEVGNGAGPTQEWALTALLPGQPHGACTIPHARPPCQGDAGHLAVAKVPIGDVHLTGSLEVEVLH